MSKHYYLSEMTVSEHHGGGLTLWRTLQDSLDEIDRFIHLNQYSVRDAPIMAKFAERQLNLFEVVPTVGPRYISVRQKLDRGWAKFRGQSWEDWSHDWWIRECTRHLLRTLRVQHSTWLVVPQDVQAVRIANELWRRCRIRYVTWIMDDHVVRWHEGWRYPPGFEADFRFHLQHASSVLVISESMRQEYARRFGIDSQVLFGPADYAGTPVVQSPQPEGPLALCYFGAVKPWQLDALASLVTVLDRLDATLDVFGLQALPPALLTERVRVQTPVAAGEVPRRMREYDGVVVPASFLAELRHLTQLNTATKMSECYASGTVPVIVAPKYAAMVQFAEQHGGAVVVTDLSDDTQLDALREIKQRDVRTRLLGAARQVSETVCSTPGMRQVWDRAWSAVGSDAPVAAQG